MMNLFTQCPTTHNKNGGHRYALTHLFFSIKYSWTLGKKIAWSNQFLLTRSVGLDLK